MTGDPEAYWTALADAERDAQPQEEPPEEPFDFDDEGEMRVRLPRLSSKLLD